jgi:D-amino-acid oxidase
VSKSLAIIGAGVSGLTSAIVFAERGYRAAIFAEETAQCTTSAAAAALWYPYDAEPADKVIAWALETYKVLVDLSRDSPSGVSMIELLQFSRTGEIEIPDWAIRLGAHRLPVMSSGAETSLVVDASAFKSCFIIDVPLMDTTIYLDYLANRFAKAGGKINGNVHFENLEDVDPNFDLVINCSGVGARKLVRDMDLEPHRGQVAIVPKIKDLRRAIVCDEPPLMYAIPRTQDCVFGGTNELSNRRDVDPTATSRIVAECSRVLNINRPQVLAERVGLRPFRKTGVRIEHEKLRDGRSVIHNYGHGGSGFTLSWGCAEEVFKIIRG